MDEEVHTVQDWDNNGAKNHLAKSTERNVQIAKRRFALLHFMSVQRLVIFGLVAMSTAGPNDRAIIFDHF